jgi:hypothetical protein
VTGFARAPGKEGGPDIHAASVPGDEAKTHFFFYYTIQSSEIYEIMESVFVPNA